MTDVNRPVRTPGSQRETGLFGDVVHRLGQDIVTGRIAEGEILFTDHLCNALGVSRSVLREALRTLASMGLIEARPHRGTRVLPMASWNLLDSRVIRWRGLGTDYLQQQRELLELRLGVEGVAARLAAMRSDEDDARALLGHAEEMGRCLAAGDRHGFFSADADFHSVLMHASGNLVIAQFSHTISAVLMARSHDLRPGMRELLAESVDRHVGLARAVIAKDPDAAEERARAIVWSTLDEADHP